MPKVEIDDMFCYLSGHIKSPRFTRGLGIVISLFQLSRIFHLDVYIQC